ncbi:hypothetical protein ASG25_01645 [Rhizobium sp. Leaf384]|uniref:hypothetical protein n=1 Tax=unclassified Rhizobium TaxID=2613769 RepID=UPI000715BDD6|nr:MULTISPECIES: hypothetical protein [unclassified Rhizobium]KQR73430.1 hypothetical protein ASG03_01090 [Rhizobium sp. Leaf341]KQS74154.1 hypothetical protein ASG58_16710 [Rhizobium sp. Leaf383]KQS80349.1 hypothetical protein ASG25_01645 [Rhizobium sp. Leaf384]
MPTRNFGHLAEGHPDAQHASRGGHALERVFEDHCTAGAETGDIAAARRIHVFQCGMISEAALQDLLQDSARGRSER